MRKKDERLGEIAGYYLTKRERSPFFHATWFDAATRQTKRASLGTDNLQEAEIRLAEFVAKRARVCDQGQGEPQLASVLVRYWHGHVCRTDASGSLIRIASHEQARVALALWTEHWGDAIVADLSIARQQAFVEWLKGRGSKNSYVSRVLSVGRAAINWARKHQEITNAPYIIDVSDRSDQEEKRRLSKPEMRRLLITAREKWPHLHIFCMIALNTLARPDAVLDLSPAQVDLDERRIDLNPRGRKRTKKQRPVVPITDTLLPYLQDRDVVRFVAWHGEPIQSVKKGFATLAKAAGLPPEITPYCLRHTMATELRKRGVNYWEVQGFLGHRMPGVTERYAKYAPDYLSEGREAIDDYFAELDLSANCISPEGDICVSPACHSPEPEKSPAGDFLTISRGRMVGVTGIEPVTPTMST
jgi:integrase